MSAAQQNRVAAPITTAITMPIMMMMNIPLNKLTEWKTMQCAEQGQHWDTWTKLGSHPT